MRIEKVSILNEVVQRVKDSDYCFIINYGGVDVVKMAALRADLLACDSRLLVVKKMSWSDSIESMLSGPTAIVTGKGEPTAVAKAVVKFVEGSDGRASVKGADYDGNIVDAKMVEALSKIPGKNELRATFLMLLKEPATRLARVLSEKAKKAE